MSTTHQKLWFAAKLLLTLVVVLIAFAVVIPNCIVPASASHPGYFAWSGLAGPAIISCIGIYCVWFWK